MKLSMLLSLALAIAVGACHSDDDAAAHHDAGHAGEHDAGRDAGQNNGHTGTDAGQLPSGGTGSTAGVGASAVDAGAPALDAATPTQDAGTNAANGCARSGLTWQHASKTNYTSFPAPGSDECVKYNGCMYEGEFAGCDSMQSKSWVMAHNIVAVHEKDFHGLQLHDLCLRDPSNPSNTILVTVYDECADSDCDGCCTDNAKPSGYLIDVESYTDARFGVDDGQIEWADLGPTTGGGCN